MERFLVFYLAFSFCPFGLSSQLNCLEIPLMTCSECQTTSLLESFQAINVLEMVTEEEFSGFNSINFILDLSSPLLISLSDSDFCFRSFAGPEPFLDPAWLLKSQESNECRLIDENQVELAYYGSFMGETFEDVQFSLYSVPGSFEPIYYSFEQFEEEMFYFSPELSSSAFSNIFQDVHGMYGLADGYSAGSGDFGDFMKGENGGMGTMASL